MVLAAVSGFKVNMVKASTTSAKHKGNQSNRYTSVS